MSTEASASRSCDLAWFKSSYSGTNGGDCVEVAAAPGAVHVRDSKEAQGAVLRFSPGEWSAFVTYAKDAAAEIG
jgi:hypothetical protein